MESVTYNRAIELLYYVYIAERFSSKTSSAPRSNPPISSYKVITACSLRPLAPLDKKSLQISTKCYTVTPRKVKRGIMAKLGPDNDDATDME